MATEEADSQRLKEDQGSNLCESGGDDMLLKCLMISGRYTTHYPMEPLLEYNYFVKKSVQ
ncbi:MAG: hypothetical protein ACI90V_012174 [Bacillariaceae sp.]|jgi:hypothetical protein